MLKFLCENAKEMLNPINWEEDSQAWKLRANVGFGAKIVKKMSNQLWYSIPLDFPGLEELTTVEVSKSEIGSMMREILKSLDR